MGFALAFGTFVEWSQISETLYKTHRGLCTAVVGECVRDCALIWGECTVGKKRGTMVHVIVTLVLIAKTALHRNPI